MQIPQPDIFTTWTIKIIWGLTVIKQEMIFFISQIGKLLWREKKSAAQSNTKLSSIGQENYLNVTCFHLLFSSANVPSWLAFLLK